MYALKLVIVPTGALIFRRVPFATTYFPTYPFVPPPTLSGYLRRLAMLAAGNAPPGKIEIPQGEKRKFLNDYAEFFVLPPDYIVLGAFPPQKRYTIHRTKRHQPWGPFGAFEHTKFSAIRYEQAPKTKEEKREEQRRQPQIPEWEYLLCERFIGFVLHENTDALAQLAGVKGWGCKLGKEGYAFVEDVVGPLELREIEQEAIPATPVPADEKSLRGKPIDIFTLYRYVWQTDKYPPPESDKGLPTDALKFQLFSAAWTDQAQPVELKYYTDGQDYIPVAWVEKLRGVE